MEKKEMGIEDKLIEVNSKILRDLEFYMLSYFNNCDNGVAVSYPTNFNVYHQINAYKKNLRGG